MSRQRKSHITIIGKENLRIRRNIFCIFVLSPVNPIPVEFFTEIFLKEIFITDGQCLKQGSEGKCSVLISAVLEK